MKNPAPAPSSRPRRVDLQSALNYAFWVRFLDCAKQRGDFFRGHPPVSGGYRDLHVGWKNVKYVVHAADHHLMVSLFIEYPEYDANLEVFKALQMKQASIEEAFGGPLEWKSKRKKTCSVGKTVSVGGLLDVEHWPEVATATIDALERLEAALRGPLEDLDLPPADRPTSA